MGSVARRKLKNQTRNPKSKQIEMIKKVKESNDGKRLVCDCFGFMDFIRV